LYIEVLLLGKFLPRFSAIFPDRLCDARGGRAGRRGATRISPDYRGGVPRRPSQTTKKARWCGGKPTVGSRLPDEGYALFGGRQL